MNKKILFFVIIIQLLSCNKQVNNTLDLSKATVLISPAINSNFQKTATTVLTEEIKKRTQLNLTLSDKKLSKTIIALALSTDKNIANLKVPQRDYDNVEFKKEGYRLVYENKVDKNILWIIGADKRAILYGIGKLLRTANMSEGQFSVASTLDISEAPQYELRGHQFGYRNTANSWDSWTIEQFDQHFREQVLFGANSFENIPFQKPNSSVHFKVDPQKMEVELSKICDKYDAEYWVWTPAPKDLTIENAPEEGLKEQEEFYARVPRLDGVFVPGGDPGDNHPSVLMPYLEKLSTLLKKHHPDAGIWVSLQGFEEEKVDYFFNYLNENKPEWLRGLVYGPSSPPIQLERELLSKEYKHRFYPDITHTVRCHYPVDNWDQAFALTLGREPSNPQPKYYAKLFNQDSQYTDGFITYSDGSHDDINKVVWSQLGWNPNVDINNTVLEYCRFYFGNNVAEGATIGVFSLEKNWDGPLIGNGIVKETLSLWQQLETENPQLQDNWRWQQLIMRAYYDAYIQDRLTYEKNLEVEAYKILAHAKNKGIEQTMLEALVHLQKADSLPVAQDLKNKVFEYAEALFKSVGAQTSVPKYNASGFERGAILDLIDYPLNNRWWLEDEFKKIETLKTEEEKLARIKFLRTYDNPSEGSFYDNISSADAKHVTSKTDDAIDFLWEKDGLSRKRLSTQLFQFTPELEYDELDSNSNYIIRVSGYGEALLRANGERLKPTNYEKDFEQFKEFPLSKELIKDGKLKITFDKPDEEHLNWRKQSRVTDVWVLKE
ncbi:hypothetical protein [Aurantibacter sp.]|uniref:hypothetical protein n=1 Tax=Aurantibacter sp. TaxID=2807103 RepID=UPI003265B167